MPKRVLRCAIEEVVDWHPQLFLEPHVVGCVAVMKEYSDSPAMFEVECENISSRWLKKAQRFALEVSWTEEMAERADRLRATMQSRPLVEIAAIALAMILVHRVIPLGPLDVTAYGERADYRSLMVPQVLEISGTETLSELGRRHREKVDQALANPFGWDACVVVSAFSAKGHQILLSGHHAEEATHAEGED